MPEFTKIVRDLSADKFAEIFSASTRKARETYYHRHGIRKGKKSNRIASLSHKNEERTAHLYELLKQKEDDELVEEVLRTWLLGKRDMLGAALDHLGIEHDQGLTESDDIDGKFENMSAQEIEELIGKLNSFPREDVEVYLRFMGAKISA